MYVSYLINNLEELLEMAKSIQAEVDADAGRSVHPSEISIEGTEWAHIEFNLSSANLSDGSTVYNVEAA
jgi:hypothetical protein